MQWSNESLRLLKSLCATVAPRRQKLSALSESMATRANHWSEIAPSRSPQWRDGSRMATTCCIDDLDRVLERALRVEGAAAPLMPQHKSMAQSLLMKIVSERVLIFVRHLSAAPRQC